MQQGLIVLRPVYATRAFERVIGDFFGVSVFASCTVIYKVSRANAKCKGNFLSFPDNLTDTKGKFDDLAQFQGVIGPSIVPTLGSYIQKIRKEKRKENDVAFINRKQF